jgi:threonine dehydrogenase-like Zn-dependent dehydrogenase
MENYCQQPGGPAAGGLGRRDGGMAEFLLVPAARYLIPLGSLDPRDAAPLSDPALTSYHAINRSRQLLAPGSTAVVIGAGGLGQMAIQILRALSATTTIVAVDTGPDKLQTARQMGADEALVSGDEAIQRINDITTGQGAELVLDMVSVDRTLQMAAKVSRVLGHLTIVGLGGGAFQSTSIARATSVLLRHRFGVRSPSSSTWLTSPRPARSACSSSTSRWNAPARPINSCTTARSRDAPSSHPTTRGVSPDASADADASTPTAGAHAHIEIGFRRFR